METQKIHQWLTKIYTILPWVPVVGLLMIISSMPYDWTAYQRVAAYVFVFGYAIYYAAYRKWTDIHWNSRQWLYIIFVAIFLLFPLSILFDTNPPTEYFWHQFHRHEWFLYVGIIGILGFPDKLKLRHVAYVMLATSCVMLCQVLYLYFTTDEAAIMSYYGSLVRLDIIRRTHINSHMVMNLYMNTALLFGFCTLKELKQGWKQALLIVGMMLTWTLILISTGRNGMLMSLVIVGVGVLYFLAKWNRYVAMGATLIVLLIAGVIIAQKPRLAPRILKHEPRIAIWDYSIRKIAEKPITGYGLSSMDEQFVEAAYQDTVMYNGFLEPIILNYPNFAEQGRTLYTHHPHNAFLMYWLAFGIVGVVLLISLFAIAAGLIKTTDRLFLWLFLLTLFVQCQLEPIGDHLMPQFIAIMLFVWEKTINSPHPTGTKISPTA